MSINMTPGSPEAKKKGCTCSAGANGHGLGAYFGIKDADGQPIFQIDPNCYIHASQAGLNIFGPAFRQQASLSGNRSGHFNRQTSAGLSR